MPHDIGEDTRIADLLAIGDTDTTFATKVAEILDNALQSSKNAFGSASTKDAGSGSGDVPEIQDGGRLLRSIVAAATTTAVGALQQCTLAELQAGTVDNKYVSAAVLAQLEALTTRDGLVELADSSDANTENRKALTAAEGKRRVDASGVPTGVSTANPVPRRLTVRTFPARRATDTSTTIHLKARASLGMANWHTMYPMIAVAWKRNSAAETQISYLPSSQIPTSLPSIRSRTNFGLTNTTLTGGGLEAEEGHRPPGGVAIHIIARRNGTNIEIYAWGGLGLGIVNRLTPTSTSQVIQDIYAYSGSPGSSGTPTPDTGTLADAMTAFSLQEAFSQPSGIRNPIVLTPAYSADVYSYTGSTSQSRARFTVTAAAGTSISINGITGGSPGVARQVEISLDAGSNTITLVVSQTGRANRTYTFTITRT